LEGLAGGEQKIIPLPVPVKIQGSRAQISENILLVKLPKQTSSREKEITIQFL
jgi:HSP20 family molecular chaperone IbpA